MIPEFDVGCYIDYSPDTLRETTAEDVASYPGPGWNRDYRPLYDVTWDEVEGALDIERKALDRASRAYDAAGFEATLAAVVEEAYENEDDGFFCYIGGMDLGVAALVMAIVAAGGTTYNACRGRAPGSLHLQQHPYVGVVLDRDRAALTSRFVLEAGCCLYSGEEGYLAIGAPSVEHCHRLARTMIENRHLFDRLPAPTWRDGLEDLVD
ncbi:hypothetical protein FXF51_35925 [Nonomuraea sp. PA05]|uniref:hypothetical protein n=1 Tax=Nonomuraea sp. PA05 TaxID=2604466 RepID=UPI0011DAE2EA|nr:hypothetical protein [Nonomuraea sp. PA05]TYB58916.1 hypothetical protein FXF51_35925 [Nonomuraea sp. PA05]